MERVFPWVDEVMFQDVAWHWVNGDGWITYAWYNLGGGSFSYYPPLYQILLAAWMKIFGTSLLVCRSINLLFFFILGFVLLRLIEKINRESIGIILTVSYSILLWGGIELSRMYRQGRPDILMAVLFVFVMFYFYEYVIEKKKNYIPLALSSSLLITSGFPPCIVVALVCIVCSIVLKDARRECFLASSFIGLGFIIGAFFMLVFFQIHHQTIYFIINTASYSALLQKIYNACIDVFQLPYYKLQTIAGVKEGYLQLLFSYFSFVVLLLAGAAMICIAYFRSLSYRVPLLLTIISLLVPVVMGIGGRYVFYYRWMMFLPMLVAFILIVAKLHFHKTSVLFAIICGAVGGASFFKAMPEFIDWELEYNVDMKKVNGFVETLPIKKGDRVASPFIAYYSLHEKTPKAYFMNIEGFSKDSPYDYILLNRGETPEYGKEFLYELLDNYKKSQEYDVTLINRLPEIEIEAYKVIRKAKSLE